MASASVAIMIFAFRAWVWVLWDDRTNGCSQAGPQSRPGGLSLAVGTSRLEPAAGISDNFPNELARVCDSVGKSESPAWRGLDAAFASRFVMYSQTDSDADRHGDSPA